MNVHVLLAAMLLRLMPYVAEAQNSEINSRDLRGKVVYQDDEVVFRQLDDHTASNGNNGGMDMMVDDKGVRINFSSRYGMK